MAQWFSVVKGLPFQRTLVQFIAHTLQSSPREPSSGFQKTLIHILHIHAVYVYV